MLVPKEPKNEYIHQPVHAETVKISMANKKILVLLNINVDGTHIKFLLAKALLLD